MSFDKAAIKRFNEELSCAPPPTKYDPKFSNGSTAKNINFGKGSERKELNGARDGFIGFVTPAKPTRGRSLYPASASARSCSDSRLRKGSRSASTKSLQDITASTHRDGPGDGHPVSEQNKDIDERDQRVAAMEIMQSFYDEEKKCLVSKIEEMEKTLTEATSSYATISEKLDACKVQYKALEEKSALNIQLLEDELNTLKSENLGLQKNLEQLDLCNLQYKALEESRALNIQELEDKLKISTAINDNLKSENMGLQKNAEELIETKQQLAAVKAEVSSRDAINEKLTTENETLKKEKDTLSEKTQLLENKLDHMTEQVKNIVQERDQLVEKQSVYEEEKKSLAAKMEEMERTIAEATLSYATITEKLDVCNLQYKTLEEKSALDIQLMEDEMKSCTAMNDILKSENSRLQKSAEELLEIKKQLADVHSQLDSRDAEIGNLANENKVLKMEKDSLSENTQRLITELEEIKVVAKESEQKVASQQSEIMSMRESMQMMENTIAEATSSFAAISEKLDERNLQYKALEEKSALEFQELEDQLQSYTTMIEILKSENTRLQKNAEELVETKQQLADVKSQLDCQDAENEKLSIENNALKMEKDSLSENTQRLMAELEQAREIAVETERRLASQQNEIMSMSENMQMMQTAFENEKVSLIAQMEEMETTISEATLSYATITEQLDVRNLQYKALEEKSALDIQELEDKLKIYTAINDNLKSENTRLQKSAEELEEMKKTLLDVLSQLDRQDAEVGKLTMENKALEMEKETLSETTQRLMAELEQTKIVAVEAEKRISSQQDEIMSMNETMQMMQTGFDDEKRILTAKIEEMKKMISDTTSSYATISEKLDACNLQYKTLEEKSALDIQQLEDELKSCTATNDILKSENTHLQKNVEELVETKQQLADVKSQLDHQDAENEKLTMENQALKTEKDALSENTQRLMAELDHTREVATETDKIVASQQNEIMSMSENMQMLEKTIAEATLSYATISEQLEECNLQYKALKEKSTLDIQQMEDKLQSFTSMNDILKSENSRLQKNAEELVEIKKKLADVHSQVVCRDAEIGKLATQNKVLQMEKEAVSENTQRLMNELEHTRLVAVETEKRLTSQQNEILSMSENVQMLEEQLRRNNQSLEPLQAQIQSLMLENKALRENLEQYKSVYGDYANLAGHQNSRQRIKHIMNIKDENIKLREENSVLRQKIGELKEKVRQQSTPSSQTTRRFDPSQAFKPVLKEPFIREERDIRGADARSTFTVPPKRPNPKPTVTIVDSSIKKESKQGMAFDVTFCENKENNG